MVRLQQKLCSFCVCVCVFFAWMFYGYLNKSISCKCDHCLPWQNLQTAGSGRARRIQWSTLVLIITVANAYAFRAALHSHVTCSPRNLAAVVFLFWRASFYTSQSFLFNLSKKASLSKQNHCFSWPSSMQSEVHFVPTHKNTTRLSPFWLSFSFSFVCIEMLRLGGAWSEQEPKTKSLNDYHFHINKINGIINP